jgi:glycosyltransferase involved in cell wall biosynthesis
MVRSNSKAIKVLLSPEANTTGFGGPLNVAYYLSAELKKHVQISCYPSFRSSFHTVSPWEYATQLVRLWATTWKHSYDIAHFIMGPSFINGSYPLALFARENGLPLILNVHGIIHMEQPFHKKQFLYQAKSLTHKAAVLTLCKKASRIVVNSRFSFNRVIEWYNVEPEKVAVIPNGIDLKLFQNLPDPHERVMLEGDPCVLFVGRLDTSKGVDTLIKGIAIAKRDLPDIKLHVIGNSNYIPPSMKSLIAKEGVETNVSFHGRLCQTELPHYYKAADFCVFPSKFETFGIVILEAMASGTPIIASDIEAFREIAKGTSALFLRGSKPEDLGNATLKLASDSNLRKRLSKNALEVVQTYDWSNIALKYLELYKVLLANAV